MILSILATAALPFVETTVIRSKELELHRVLREVRSAIDNFHDDWVIGKISKTNSNVSEDGYPRTLQILVEGIEGSDVKGKKRRYLRQIPRDPFLEQDKTALEDWKVRGYQDELESTVWGRGDIYDIRSMSERSALDGTRYKDW
jgi:general secretion pathway protein G